LAATAASAAVGKGGESAVSTGSEMIVWGGVTRFIGYGFTASSDGAAYNPATNR
jgi:hypothetical protein